MHAHRLTANYITFQSFYSTVRFESGAMAPWHSSPTWPAARFAEALRDGTLDELALEIEQRRADREPPELFFFRLAVGGLGRSRTVGFGCGRLGSGG